jgi:cation transport ATPase
MGIEQRTLKRTDETLPGLWRFYEEHASQARQHEDLRATVTSILCAIAAAVVGLASLGGLDKADIPAGIVVVVLALLGVALSLKHYERNRLHTEILGAIREEITRLDQDETAVPRSTQEIRREAEKKHNSSFTILKHQEKVAKSPWVKVRLHILWLGLPIAVGVVGVLVIVLAIVGVAATPS